MLLRITAIALAFSAAAGIAAATAAPYSAPGAVGLAGASTHVVNAAVVSAPPRGRTRICVGPARIEVGMGATPRIIFGGEGCTRSADALIAWKFLPPAKSTPSVVVSVLAS